MLSLSVLFNRAWMSEMFKGFLSSDATFVGFGDLIQLFETYRDLLLILGAIIFVIGVVILIFPGARNFLGSWV